MRGSPITSSISMSLTNWKYWSSWIIPEHNSLHCWFVLNLKSVRCHWRLVPCFAKAESNIITNFLLLSIIHRLKILLHLIDWWIFKFLMKIFYFLNNFCEGKNFQIALWSHTRADSRFLQYRFFIDWDPSNCLQITAVRLRLQQNW